MTAPPWFGNLAPGNRVDMLVQAPSSAGSFPVTFGGTLLFTVNVTTPGVASPIDVPAVTECLPVDARFSRRHRSGQCRRSNGSCISRRRRGRAAPRARTSLRRTRSTARSSRITSSIRPCFSGRRKSGRSITTTSMGWPGRRIPFHIHINPFQVTEILNPLVSQDPDHAARRRGYGGTTSPIPPAGLHQVPEPVRGLHGRLRAALPHPRSRGSRHDAAGAGDQQHDAHGAQIVRAAAVTGGSARSGCRTPRPPRCRSRRRPGRWCRPAGSGCRRCSRAARPRRRARR